MTRLGVVSIAVLASALTPSGASAQAGRSTAPALRWEPEGAWVEVIGLDPANLKALAEADWTSDRWSQLFRVVIPVAGGPRATEPPPLVGSYRVVGEAIRFTPRFPVSRGLRHQARLLPAGLPVPNTLTAHTPATLTADFTRPPLAPPPPTFVVRVDPGTDQLPENLLKFYLHFSAPMSRGEVYDRVRLLDASGTPLASPFLEIGEELWDRPGTRLTLLLDPGRVKRALRPREEDGPILESGKSYTLVIDREWPDAQGFPLRATFRKAFRAGPVDERQPDPKRWSITPPAAGTQDPLIVDFHESLDRALVERGLGVQGPVGSLVAGQATVPPAADRWQLVPDRPWPAGAHRLVIDTSLEDLAGNSVARPFEVDVLHPIPRHGSEAETTTVPVEIH